MALDLFLLTREEIISGYLWTLMEYSIYSRYSTQAKLTQRQRINFSTQAKLEQQVYQQAQLRCSSAALSSDYITRPVALVQHSRGAAQRSSRHTAAAGRLRSISLVCALHKIITLTAVRTVKKIHGFTQ